VEWHAMLLLGAFHGINPGMGWLFAVALGMQTGSVRGVWRALPPIALGHALAVGVILAAAVLAEKVIPPAALNISVAVCLCSVGSYRLWRHRHPRYAGMRVGFRDLTVWSFLMASAHGAGIMLLPFVMTVPANVAAATSDHAAHMTHMAIATSAASPWSGVMAVGVHTAGYLLVMTLTAWVVYRRLGLGFLRSTWFNLDWLWAGALIVTGATVLLR